MAQNYKVKFSSSLMNLKFMSAAKKRPKNKNVSSENDHKVRKKAEELKNILYIPTSIIICKHLAVGRLSFGGMNHEIEKLMTIYNKKMNEIDKRKEMDVSDKGMVNYIRTINTIRKKFQAKKNRFKNSPKFLSK